MYPARASIASLLRELSASVGIGRHRSCAAAGRACCARQLRRWPARQLTYTAIVGCLLVGPCPSASRAFGASIEAARQSDEVATSGGAEKSVVAQQRGDLLGATSQRLNVRRSTRHFRPAAEWPCHRLSNCRWMPTLACAAAGKRGDAPTLLLIVADKTAWRRSLVAALVAQGAWIRSARRQHQARLWRSCKRSLLMPPLAPVSPHWAQAWAAQSTEVADPGVPFAAAVALPARRSCRGAHPPRDRDKRQARHAAQ